MFTSVVVGTDGSPRGDKAVRAAIELAQISSSRLHVVSAYQPPVFPRARGDEREEGFEGTNRYWEARLRKDTEAVVAESAAGIPAGGLEILTYVIQGDPADAILDVAEDKKADIIVVGNKGMSGKRRFVLGSVANKVSHHAPCSVLIVDTGENS